MGTPVILLSSFYLVMAAVSLLFQLDLIFVGIIGVVTLAVVLFAPKPNLPNVVESSELEVFQTPPTASPKNFAERLARVKNFIYQVRTSKWFIPTLAVIAFVVGYFSFRLIAVLDGEMLALVYSSDLLSSILGYFSLSDFEILAFVEQVFLGGATLVLFAVSKKYYIPLLLYAGFLARYVGIQYSQYHGGDGISLISFLTPVFVYALAFLIFSLGLAISLKLGKKGLFMVATMTIAVVINVFIMNNYNSDPHPIQYYFPFIGKLFLQTASTPEVPSDLKQSGGEPVSEIKEPAKESATQDTVSFGEDASSIKWRALDAESRQLRTPRISDLGVTFCFYRVISKICHQKSVL